MKALITGGTGFIGSHLTEFLIDKGFEVTALVRDRNNLKWLNGLDINFLNGDLLSIPALPNDIDYVFHAAGLTKASNVIDYYTVNQLGTASLFQSLRSQKIYPKKIIYFSSLAAAGPSVDNNPVRESDLPHPISPYGESKLMGEIEALKFKGEFPIVILRVAAVFGPRDKDFLSYFKLIKQGILPSLGCKKRLMSVCYIKDLTEAVYLCLEKELESGEVLNIAYHNPCEWDEFGKAAGKALGKKIIKAKIPAPLGYLAALLNDARSRITGTPIVMGRNKFKEMRQSGWVADTTKAKDKLPFWPRYSIEKAVEETVDWYRKQGWL